MTPRILVAGIGNIFLGDDAFGGEVAQKLMTRELGPNVRVVDFGIRGFDLAYALMEDYDLIILVDALPRGEAPGTLFTIEPDWDSISASNAEEASVETHGMNPMKVLAMVKAMQGRPKQLLVVGCEPSPYNPADEEEGRMGLSEPVQAAVNDAVRMVEELLAQNDIAGPIGTPALVVDNELDLELGETA